MEEEIMVSICCLVYNHEKYLRKCLDGFVMQKTNFKYEVLIHDDASTDSSADIIREYEKKYPDIIKPIYQKENQYSKGVKISWEYQYPRANGKYIAWCEGDDYWCDENKLQLQFDTMENDNDIAISFHKVQLINEDGSLINEYYPNGDIDISVLSPKRFMREMSEKDSYPFQTSSYFARTKFIKEINNNRPEFMEKAKVGDVPLMLYMITKGNVMYINRVMSHYRINSVGSWSSTNRNKKEKMIIQQKNDITVYNLYNEYSKREFQEYIDLIIRNKEFLIYITEGNYKKIINNDYKMFFENLPIKQRIYYYLCNFIPGFQKIYRSLKNNG